MNLDNMLADLRGFDFKQLDPNEPGNWPVAVKAIVLLLVLAAVVLAGYLLDWSGQLDTLKSAKGEEEKLRQTFLDKKSQAINLDKYNQQLDDIQRAFGALLRQLPNKTEMDSLITDIHQAGLGRGLEFELFKPAPAEIPSDFYAVLPINISVTGSYHDFGAFASDIAQMPRIVTLENIAIAPSQGKGGGTLTMNVTAKTYRYLSDEEVAARKKTAQGKKGGAK